MRNRGERERGRWGDKGKFKLLTPNSGGTNSGATNF
jgi:hypothetical protein